MLFGTRTMIAGQPGVVVAVPQTVPFARRIVVPATVLLGGDSLLITCDILWRAEVLAHDGFSLTREAGFGELWQYAKAGTIAGLLLVVSARHRSLVKLCWAALFLFILADDAGQWHERAGLYLARELALPAVAGLRGNHVGELLFFLAAGLIAGSVVLAASLRGSAADVAFTREMLMWLGVLAFFAVLLDGVHSALRYTRLNDVLAVAEDGGEMLALSCLLAYLCGRDYARA